MPRAELLSVSKRQRRVAAGTETRLPSSAHRLGPLVYAQPAAPTNSAEAGEEQSSVDTRLARLAHFQTCVGDFLNAAHPTTGAPLVVLEHQCKAAQRVSRALIKRGEARHVLAHDMGTGKTVTATVLIALLSCMSKASGKACKGLVVVPVSMLHSWKTTLLQWLKLDPDVDLVVGKSGMSAPSAEAFAQAKVVLVTKDRLVGWLKSFVAWNATAEECVARNGRSYFRGSYERRAGVEHAHPLFALAPSLDFVVVDEVHMVKNPKTWVAEAIRRFTRHATTCVGLTGTPVSNDLKDVSRTLRLLGETDADLIDEKLWTGTLVDPARVRKQKRSIDIVSRDVIFPPLPSREDALRVFDAQVGHQPDVAEALYDALPRVAAQRAQTSPVVLYNEQLELARDAAARMRDEEGGRDAFAALMGALAFLTAALWSIDWALARSERFLACPAALDAAAAKPTATLRALAAAVAAEQADGHARVAVYNPLVTALRIAEASLLAEGKCGDVFLFHGGLSTLARTEMVAAFLACPKGVLLLSPAGGLGLTICPGCEVMIFCGYPWSPMELEQAACRVWRIGQNRPVRFVHLVASGSIHSAMREMYADKNRLAKMVLREDFQEGLQWKLKSGVIKMMRYADAAGNLESPFLQKKKKAWVAAFASQRASL